MQKFIDKLFKGIDCFTGILTGLMMFFVFLNVILRAFFNSGLTWSEELSRYLFVFVTYIGAISAMRVNGHLGVDTLISRVNPKMQMLMYIVSQTLIVAIMGILIAGTQKMVLQNMESRTAALSIPYAALYAIGFVTGAAIAAIAIRNIIYAIRHSEEISSIVVMSTSDDDEIIAETRNDSETMTDEEYRKSLREDGGNDQ